MYLSLAIVLCFGGADGFAANLNISIKVLQNTLEIFENSSMSKIMHIPFSPLSY